MSGTYNRRGALSLRCSHTPCTLTYVTTYHDTLEHDMARTNTPTACPTCHALTFDGRVNVKVWTGDNGAQRFYPAGDHAPVCAANVARQAAEDAYLADMAAWREAERVHLAMLARWGARVSPLIAAHTGDQAYLDRVGATIDRLVARTPRPPQR